MYKCNRLWFAETYNANFILPTRLEEIFKFPASGIECESHFLCDFFPEPNMSSSNDFMTYS